MEREKNGLIIHCKKMKMILFCKRDFQSVQSAPRFELCTGLVAISSNSAIFGCDLDTEEMQRIAYYSGFKKGVLPFRYFGVPIK